MWVLLKDASTMPQVCSVEIFGGYSDMGVWVEKRGHRGVGLRGRLERSVMVFADYALSALYDDCEDRQPIRVTSLLLISNQPDQKHNAQPRGWPTNNKSQPKGQVKQTFKNQRTSNPCEYKYACRDKRNKLHGSLPFMLGQPPMRNFISLITSVLLHQVIP